MAEIEYRNKILTFADPATIIPRVTRLSGIHLHIPIQSDDAAKIQGASDCRGLITLDHVGNRTE